MKWILGFVALVIAGMLASYWWMGKDLKPLDEAARANAPGSFAPLKDGLIHYRWVGPESGETIIMVHGFSTPNFIFEQNAQALANAGFRVLLFDHFGRGWSARPKTKYDVNFYDDELTGLMAALDIDEPVGLVGLSMGGPIVAEFAVRHPARVSKVAMLVPAGLDLASEDSFLTSLVRAPLLGDWLWRMTYRSVLLGDATYDQSGLEPADTLQGDVREQFAYKGYGRSLLSTFRHMPMSGRETTFWSLAETKIPVLAIYGDADETVNISSASRLRNIAKDFDVRIIKDGTHGLNYQRHTEVSPMLVSFFTESDPRP